MLMCDCVALWSVADVEEYDPTHPIVGLSANGSPNEGDEMDISDSEPYDPIVSAYSIADPQTLNAEDAPGRQCQDWRTYNMKML